MKPFVFILFSLIILSCGQTPKMQNKHGDKEQSITCENQNNPLLNEALYSFEEDLVQHNQLDEAKTLVAAYGQFMYKGMAGTASYKDIANKHSLAIRDELIAEGILITTGIKSNLNYAHPAVQCIINSIENTDLKATLNALIETNSMNPSLFNSRLRNFGGQAQKDRYQAAYIALDAYYQNLVGVSLDAETTNE